MRLAKLAAIGGVTLAAAGGAWASPASALGTFTVTPTNFTDANGDSVADQIAEIDFSGFAPNTTLYIDQCRKTTAQPPFSFVNDCSQQNGVNPNAGPTGAGHLGVEAGVGNYFVPFVGADPYLGEWGCGDTGDTGAVSYATCYIRITPGTPSNNAESVFLPITFVPDTTPPDTTPETTTTLPEVPPADVPEVPTNILLPLGALGILGAGALVVRRRNAAV